MIRYEVTWWGRTLNWRETADGRHEFTFDPDVGTPAQFTSIRVADEIIAEFARVYGRKLDLYVRTVTR